MHYTIKHITGKILSSINNSNYNKMWQVVNSGVSLQCNILNSDSSVLFSVFVA
jgi:hypothetical protein